MIFFDHLCTKWKSGTDFIPQIPAPIGSRDNLEGTQTMVRLEKSWNISTDVTQEWPLGAQKDFWLKQEEHRPI